MSAAAVVEAWAARGPVGFDLARRAPERVLSLTALNTLRWKGNKSAIPSAELRAHGLLLRRGDGGRAFLQITRSFERTPEFEAAIRGALAKRPYPAQVIWGEHDTALPVGKHGEDVRQALGVETIQRLPGKHFVQEDCPAAVAERVAALAA